MKAIEILRAFVKGEIDHEMSGIAESDAIIVQGWNKYFGARWIKGSIQPRKLYFYCYLDFDEDIQSLGCPDVYLEISSGKGTVKLWELE